jgi:hypothetical protein
LRVSSKKLEHGKDISLLNLTLEHIRRYHDTLRNLPFRVNGKNEYKGTVMAELADLGREGKVDRLLSLKTMQVRQINVRSFINWCELEYQAKFRPDYLNSGFPPAMTKQGYPPQRNQEEPDSLTTNCTRFSVTEPVI